MAKTLTLHLDDEEQLCNLGAVLNSPARIQILKLLYFNSYNVGEIAKMLNIPNSSAALYVSSLEKANLISTKVVPGSRGSMKICSRKNDTIILHLSKTDEDADKVTSISMPVGCYTSCRISPSCGIISEKGYIAPKDRPEMFFLPERMHAQLIWSKCGYVEYQFPYTLSHSARVTGVSLSFEVCSETNNYNEDWPSDITVWIDGLDCGTWRCPSDFGARRGRLNPEWWSSGCTQYGKLLILEISEHGCTLNSVFSEYPKISDLHFSADKPISVRIGNKDDAEYQGGFNIFGKKMGDFEQDIVFSMIYKP